MPTPSKRRASLYTLPLVIMIGSLSVAGLAAWKRSEMIADLADQVARGEQTKSTAAVRQLAEIPKPPLAVLVAASASDERATAEAAQAAINRMLGQWQKQVDKKQRVSSVAVQLNELAAAMAAQRRAYAPADYRWLADAAQKMLRIASQCPPQKMPLMAFHIDAILASANPTAQDATRTGSADARPMPTKSVSSPPRAEAAAAESQQEILEREFLSFPAPKFSNDAWPGTDTLASGLSIPPVTPVGDSSSPMRGLEPHFGGHERIAPPLEAIPMEQPWLPADGAPQPEWSLPIFRVMPRPVEAAEDARFSNGIKAAPPNVESAATDESAETRALLAEWFDASEYDRPRVGEKLAERGFRRLSTRIVKQYLSEDLRERLRVVDTVLTEPDVDARPWLLLLAEDEDADVRLMAVSVMATSSDPRLIEAAWHAAIRDRDPRIADLAERLKARRR